MYVQSKIALIHNDGMVDRASSIVRGTIVNTSRNADCTTLGVNYVYSLVDGEGNVTGVLKKGGFKRAGSDIQILHDEIAVGLPDPDDNEAFYEASKYHSAFMLQMLITFLPLNPELVIGDFEIVIPVVE